MALEAFRQDDFDLALKRTIRSLYTGLNKRNFKAISSLLMAIATALYTRIILSYKKNMVKIVWITPNSLQEKW